MVGDDEVKCKITSVTNNNKKLRKVLFKIEIAVGKIKKQITALVLEGLHFNVLLEMSWIKEADTIVNAAMGVVYVDGEKFKFKPYPEPALFIVEEGVRVYNCELIVLPPRKTVGVPVYHQAVTGNEVYLSIKEMS